MVAEAKGDGSMLADLEPSFYFEPRSNELRNNLRNHGSYRLKLKRISKSPAFSRKYMPGDPVNMIDWKVFARTDQLLIREETDESSAKILVCLDLGSSMVWPPPDLGMDTVTKLELAIRVALNICFIHFRMSDLVKLVVWKEGDSEPGFMLPMRSASDAVGIFHKLHPEVNADNILAEAYPANLSAEKFDKCYLVTDGLSEIRSSVLRDRCRRFHLFHTLSSREVSIDWMDHDHCYFDQSYIKREYLGSVLRDHGKYVASINKWRRKLQKRTEDQGDVYQFVTDQTTIADYQSEFVRAVSLRFSEGK